MTFNPRLTAADLFAARTALGLTQKQLAEAMDLCTRTVRRYEDGGMEIPVVFALALYALSNLSKENWSI